MNIVKEVSHFFPRVDEAKILEQKLEMTDRISKQILMDLKRNKISSLYALHQNSRWGIKLKNKNKFTFATPKNSKAPSQLKLARSPYQSEQFTSRKKLFFFHPTTTKVASLKQKVVKIFQSEIYENQNALKQNRSMQIRSNNKYRRFKTEPKVEFIVNRIKQNKKTQENFNIKGITFNIGQDSPTNQGLQLEKIKQRRHRFKKQMYLMGNYGKNSTIEPQKMSQLKMTALNGWKIQQEVD